MEVTAVSFSMLLGYLERVITRLVDPRSPSNATRYSLKDFVLGAFSAFFMQSESFLEHQRQMNSRCGRDNAQTLFGLEQVPTVEQIRNVLDGIVAQSLFPVFNWIYQALRDQGYLRAYQMLAGNLFVALDGTEYYSSQKISCSCCSTRTHKNGVVTYYHQALLPVIVSPNQESVISTSSRVYLPSRWQ